MPVSLGNFGRYISNENAAPKNYVFPHRWEVFRKHTDLRHACRFLNSVTCTIIYENYADGSVAVKTLGYKPENRGFET
jgi:hypothetical protein